MVGLTTWIAIVTVCASCLTSWTEFAGTSKKLSRYSSAVTALEKQLAWWESLGGVQKASRETIAALILHSEAVISEEQIAWTSTEQNKRMGEHAEEGGSGGGGEDPSGPVGGGSGHATVKVAPA